MRPFRPSLEKGLQMTATRTPDRQDGAAQNGRRGGRRTHTEAKAGSKTSEMYVMLAFVVGVLIATYADNDSLAHQDGWLYAGIAVAAYIVSRGLAKLGVREPYTDES